ncbi:four helix bundle protein [bacterium]|nr:four helix bundle protein [bacterium]
MNTKDQEKDIEELRKRIYNFVIRVVNLVVAGVAVSNFPKELPNNLIGNRIGGQLLDAGTSIGANFEEACAAFSKRDFT